MTQFFGDEAVAFLPYSCKVWSDNCGSMKHVERAAHAAGLQYGGLPPGSQSLNDAETAINQIQEKTLGHMAANPDLPHAVVADVMFEATYISNRSAKETRWDRTPYDMLGKGRTPGGAFVKPSRAYDVPIGTRGAVSKIVKKSSSPGVAVKGFYTPPRESWIGLPVPTACEHVGPDWQHAQSVAVRPDNQQWASDQANKPECCV